MAAGNQGIAPICDHDQVAGGDYFGDVVAAGNVHRLAEFLGLLHAVMFLAIRAHVCDWRTVLVGFDFHDLGHGRFLNQRTRLEFLWVIGCAMQGNPAGQSSQGLLAMRNDIKTV